MKHTMDVGDKVHDSGVGAVEITGFSERGFPQVNGITCAWAEFPDGSFFDPYHVMEKHKRERNPHNQTP